MRTQSDLLRAVDRSLRGRKPTPHAPVIDPLDLLGLARMRTFARLSRSLHAAQSPVELLTEILDRAVEVTGATRGLLVMTDPTTGEPQVKVAHQVEHPDLDRFDRRGRRVLDQALLGELAVHVGSAGGPSVVAVPLRVHDRVMGAAYVDRPGGPFPPEDVGFLAAFAELAAVALLTVQRLDDLNRENVELREEVGRHPRAAGFVGDSPAMREVYRLIERVAVTDTNVLVEGESGTGKEVTAKAVHHGSARRDAKFVPIHCAAIPEALIESELFGHRRGAFSGAIADRPGLFEEASHGTLFLDEIHAAPPGVQVKLLRALQEREIRRVGDNVSRKVDVRLIVAANRPLEGEVARGAFREDLYFRVAVVTIKVPPLRAHKEDILPLAEHVLRRIADRGGRPRRLTRAALDALLEHDWPGNVRELENVLQKACVLATGARIDAGDLGLAPRSVGAGRTLSAAIDAMEREMVTRAMERHGGNVSHAATELGVLRQQLQRLIRRHGLSPREFRRQSYLRRMSEMGDGPPARS